MIELLILISLPILAVAIFVVYFAMIFDIADIEEEELNNKKK